MTSYRTVPTRRARYRPATIRFLDVSISLLALLVMAPVLLGLAVLIRIMDNGPVLFAQRRIGLEGRSFRCLKFRTMCVDADAHLLAFLATDDAARLEWERDHKLKRDPRLTSVGRVLRKLSLDELPQLLNVLRGEMSLVGPRPIVAAEAERYGWRYWTYCTVRPGLTGLWQVSGRSDVRYRRRVAMDAVYARSGSVRLYMRVLMQTPAVLVSATGAY